MFWFEFLCISTLCHNCLSTGGRWKYFFLCWEKERKFLSLLVLLYCGFKTLRYNLLHHSFIMVDLLFHLPASVWRQNIQCHYSSRLLSQVYSKIFQMLCRHVSNSGTEHNPWEQREQSFGKLLRIASKIQK